MKEGSPSPVCHLSPVFVLFFLNPSEKMDKVVELVGGGSLVINRATPSSFLYYLSNHSLHGYSSDWVVQGEGDKGWRGMILHGIVWHGIIWHGMIWHGIS